MVRLLLLVALCALCAFKAEMKKEPPRLPWWAALDSSGVRRPSAYRPRPRPPSTAADNEVMKGVMDEMPSGSEMLMKAPANFSMLPTTNRIVNGQYTQINEFPYQLQLALYGRLSCGASIISKSWAITAAHCMFDNAKQRIPLNAVTFRSGATRRDSQGTVHMVTQRIMPGQYHPNGHDYDIALLKVDTPFRYSKTVKSIALPKPGQKLRDGEVGVLTGWGHTMSNGKLSDELQYVLVPMVNQRQCEEAYNTPTRKITRRMLCAGVPGRDSCQGDSGGPLAVNGRLVGLVSFGIGCALEGYPGVNTRVSAFREFIQQYAGV